MKKEIIITGSTGFIGREVLDNLISKKFSINCINKSNKIKTSNRITFIKSTLEDGFPNIFIKANTPLIHLAWNNVRNVNDSDHLDKEIKIQFNFLKKAVLTGVKKLIVAGSCYEYGMVFGPINVNHLAKPITPYGIAKLKLFKRLKKLQLKHHFELLWARIFYVYADNDDSGNIISQFDKAVRNGDKSFAMTYGEQLLDYSHVSEVSKKIIKLIEFKDGVYNICSGKPISIRRLIEKRKEEKKTKINLEFGKISYRDNEPFAFWGIPNV